uniref:Uncharacterized protein n=1 Tax=viral metagenome TaxID=1070528 RepID=A0A6C0M224_9ZZZZ
MQNQSAFWFSVVAAVILLIIMILSAASASELRKVIHSSTQPPKEVDSAYKAAVWASVLSALGVVVMAFVAWVMYEGVAGAKGKWNVGTKSLADRLRFD